MKKRSAGKKENKSSSKKWSLLVFLWGIALLCFLSVTQKDLRLKNDAQSEDRKVTLAVEWEDILIFLKRENLSAGEMLKLAKGIPTHAMMVSGNLSSRHEKILRDRGFQLIWRPDPEKQTKVKTFLNRLKEGDGLLSLGESVYGYPKQMNDVIAVIKEKNIILPKVEFAHQKGWGYLSNRLKENVVRSHCLLAKERISEKPSLWTARLVRAVEKRWIGLLYVQMSPSVSFAENLELLSSVKRKLKRKNVSFGKATSFSLWETKGFPKAYRLPLAMLLAILSPLVSILLIKRLPFKSPFLVFLVVCLGSTATGVVIHGLGSFPEVILGLQPLKGVKLQLLIPFFLVLMVLLSKSEMEKALAVNLQGIHILGAMALVFVFLGGYLMRSGNFPLIPVSDHERVFRDFIESLFGARPRFKEFLIGHPLLLLGLYMKTKSEGGVNFFKDGRVFIWLGIIGQISIINTFMHFHSPFSAGLLRTFHGVWLGFILSIPLCYAWSKFQRSRSV